MAKELLKQDRSGSRRPADVERKYRLGIIEPTAEEVEELKNKIEVDSFLSTSSIHPVQNKVITNALNNKANKEEGKGLSTNDFTDDDKDKLDNIEENAQANKIEGVYINGSELTPTNKKVNIYVDSSMSDYSENPVKNKVIKAYIDANSSSGSASTYNLANYKVSALTILRSSCIVKNDRVCINFVGTISMNANTTTTIFNLPSALQPTATKDFVVFGQSSNTDGYVGYGYVTADGLTQVRFNQAISSYIRFSVVYDLD
jgi:hypothetical protein